MPSRVTLTSHFESRFKRFAKKFASLEGEMDALIDNLTETPALGESLGAGLYKIRLASKSKGKGKRGGFRVITYLVTKTEDGTDIYLLTMYDKSEESSIKKEMLLTLAKTLLTE